jgi:hypothetical protein
MADTRQDDPKNKGLRGIFGHRDKNGTRQGGIALDIKNGMREANHELEEFSFIAPLGGAAIGLFGGLVLGSGAGIVYDQFNELPVDTDIQALQGETESYSALQRDDGTHILMVKEGENVRLFMAEPDSRQFVLIESNLQALSLSAEVVRGFEAAQQALQSQIMPQHRIYSFADVEGLSELFLDEGEYQREVAQISPQNEITADITERLQANKSFWQEGAQRIMDQQYGLTEAQTSQLKDRLEGIDFLEGGSAYGLILGLVLGSLVWPTTVVNKTVSGRRRRLGIKAKTHNKR